MCQLRLSAHADHYPLSLRELIEAGVDPHGDPALGRGLCHGCHSSETARLQPGGWHRDRDQAAEADEAEG
ncbi:hypothetical protein [Longispora albida]|uniref:hypothetical protein n=1 Tax=Longispora albida TaxID=203523 RepID=UPI00036D0A0A|nr:hypothetical protein [Longispora albida]